MIFIAVSFNQLVINIYIHLQPYCSNMVLTIKQITYMKYFSILFLVILLGCGKMKVPNPLPKTPTQILSPDYTDSFVGTYNCEHDKPYPFYFVDSLTIKVYRQSSDSLLHCLHISGFGYEDIQIPIDTSGITNSKSHYIYVGNHNIGIRDIGVEFKKDTVFIFTDECCWQNALGSIHDRYIGVKQ